MQSNEILGVVDSVSTEKGLIRMLSLKQLKLQLHLHHKGIFMRMQICSKN